MTSKTLAALEGRPLDWPDDGSYLVGTCQRLWDVPIEELEVEDLRILIGQGLGLRHLMPRALEVLQADPLAQGDFYPGDLLSAVLRSAPSFWAGNPALACRVVALAQIALARMNKKFRKKNDDIRHQIFEELGRFSDHSGGPI